MRYLELVAAFSDTGKARDLAMNTQGILLCDERDDTSHLPFAALVIAVTDDIASFRQTPDVGTYLVCRRVIKPRAKAEKLPTGQVPGVTGVFTLVAKAELGHQQADQHWRDNHAPLALKVHQAMSNYSQLSIIHRFDGPEWDGFALCGFDTIEDLRLRFFDTAAGERAIAEDVVKFSDAKKSPRRIIANEYTYAVDNEIDGSR